MNNLETDRRYDALRNLPAPTRPVLDHYGRDMWGYDLGGPAGDGEGIDEGAEEPDYGDGAPGQGLLRDALVTFARLWQRFDVTTAGVVFHIDPGLIAPLQIFLDDFAGQQPVEHLLRQCVQLLSSARTAMDPLPQQTEDAEQNLQSIMKATFTSPTTIEVAGWLNMDEARVRAIVEEHPWMLLGKERDGYPEIDHDGE
jgi:hypothetical protein